MKAKTRTIVKTFMPRFAPLVEQGLKNQTVRPMPKRELDMPRMGDRFSGRAWKGKAYYSKQRLLREGVITAVRIITIDSVGILLDGDDEYLSKTEEDRFARKDGFEDFADMRKWFTETHKLPFSGILIKWKPDGKGESNLELP